MPNGSVIQTRDAIINNKYIKGPQGTALNADHVVSFGVLQGGSQSCSAEFSELEDHGFFLVATTINDEVYDLARFDDDSHAHDAVFDLIQALDHKQSGPVIDMFLHDTRLRQVSLRNLRLDRELASRNEAVHEALSSLASSVTSAIEGQRSPAGT